MHYNAMVLGKTQTLDTIVKSVGVFQVPLITVRFWVLGFFYAQCVSLILFQTIRVFLVRRNYHVFAQNCRLYEKAPAVAWGRMGTLPLGALALLVLWCWCSGAAACALLHWCWCSGALALLEGSCSRAPLTGFWASAMLCSSFLHSSQNVFSFLLRFSSQTRSNEQMYHLEDLCLVK